VFITAPVLLVILAATAVPVELRPGDYARLTTQIQPLDFAENVIGYVPVGLVLAPMGIGWALLTGTVLSVFAESTQLLMLYRDPSVMDVLANLIGTALGVTAASLWGRRRLALTVTRRTSWIATATTLILSSGVWLSSGTDFNARGASLPGTLEGRWRLQHSQGRTAPDSSGQGHDGRFGAEPSQTSGPGGGGTWFDARVQYVEVDSSTPFRLVGSMTIAAWIYPTSDPGGDAAIVSMLRSRAGRPNGYQLDTSVDRGPRMAGLKLADACGNDMARYGATPLEFNKWYHVAAVYDADRRTMDMYLNGRLDNGFLLGEVTARQRTSRIALTIGKRSDRDNDSFAGAIGDVQIYSRALTASEIEQVVQGHAVAADSAAKEAERPRVPSSELYAVPGSGCTWSSEIEDVRVPGAVALIGVLAALAFAGWSPAARPASWMLVSAIAGGLVALSASSSLPVISRWLFPVLAAAAGASVALSVERVEPAPVEAAR